MRVSIFVLLVFSFVFTSVAQERVMVREKTPRPLRPVHTFSIVARDPNTGELGVAVQSHWFSVGSIVAWAEAGVGAVATQSFLDPSYGKNGLDMMRAGKSAPDTLKELLGKDDGREVRQVAMIDAQAISPSAHTQTVRFHVAVAGVAASCTARTTHTSASSASVPISLISTTSVPPSAVARSMSALRLSKSSAVRGSW